MRSGRGIVEFKEEFVRVAPEPTLFGLVGADDRVLCRLVMSGGVAVLGVVATADMAARRAHPQMLPPIAHLQALHASVARRSDILDLIEVGAFGFVFVGRHDLRSFDPITKAQR